MEVGTLGEWVTALVGFGAALAALLAWKTSMASLARQRENDEAKRARHRREQANLVFAVGARLPNRRGAEGWGLYIYNGSDKPIRWVEVRSQRADGLSSNPILTLTVVPPGMFLIPGDATFGWGNLVDLSLAPEPVSPLVKGKAGEVVQCLVFEDALGQRWKREGQGDIESAE